MSPHGTRGRYQTGCLCRPCRDAEFRYAKKLKVDRLQYGSRLIDGTGTRRRLQGLAYMGWSRPLIGARLGITKQAVADLDRPGRPVRRDTANRIARLYDELHMAPGPSSAVAALARKRGYQPPLAWDNIDDPTETPHRPTMRDSDIIDEVVVWRMTQGHRVDTPTPAERVEATRRLAYLGHSDPEISQALHIETRSVLRIRAQHGIPPGAADTTTSREEVA